MNTITIDQIPGYAAQVWNGWIWITGATEHKWSKAETQDACEKIVIEACQRLGIDGALED